MPELPEVETVRNTLKNFILGKEIRDVDIFYDRMIRNVDINTFKENIIGKKITDIHRRGKYLIFQLDNLALISHLRMEGKYFIKDLDKPKEKHEHVIFYFTDGVTLRYQDTRKFGTFDLVQMNEIYTNSPVQKLGFEPWDEGLNITYLKEKLQHKTTTIKQALLDQSIITGLGNIYVDEVLFMCKLHPETKANKLQRKDYQNIINNSKKVLEKAVKLGGTTIRSYTSSLGVTGRFQNELLVHMRENETCHECGTIIIKKKVNGRGTYICPKCQRQK